MDKNFYNEIYFRCNSAINSLDAFQYIKDNCDLPSGIQSTIKYALARFSILQLTTILDSTSRYSLRVECSSKNIPHIELLRLKKIFPNIDSVDEIVLIKKEIDKILNDNKKLFKRFFHMRNSRIAHAGTSSFQRNELDIKIFNFPIKKITRFADNLQGVFNRQVFKTSVVTLKRIS